MCPQSCSLFNFIVCLLLSQSQHISAMSKAHGSGLNLEVPLPNTIQPIGRPPGLVSQASIMILPLLWFIHLSGIVGAMHSISWTLTFVCTWVDSV